MTENKPCCRTCGYKNAYYRANAKAERLEYYCDHPYAREAFEEYGGVGSPQFIGFSVKGDTVPQIKTSPRWCPLKYPKEFDVLCPF